MFGFNKFLFLKLSTIQKFSHLQMSMKSKISSNK